jgi:hypothetical protein
MRSTTPLFLLAIILPLALSGCGMGLCPTAAPVIHTPTSVSPVLTLTTATSVPVTPTLPAPTPTPRGRAIVVTSTADSGPGTLRQSLLTAQPYDTITFDPAVFPPDAPQTIAVTSGLPQIRQGYLTIDASDAGVILDGSQLPTDSWIPGLEIVSDENTIRGMQVVHFTGTGIVVALHGRNNTVGGDRGIGAGPTGQGNLCSANDHGLQRAAWIV